MTQKDKNKLFSEIKRLLKQSYKDDGNSYELEFREILEELVYSWNELTDGKRSRSSKKHAVRIIFGEEASDYAAEHSSRAAVMAINSGKISGSVETYKLDSKEDMETLIQAVDDMNGWMDYCLYNDWN